MSRLTKMRAELQSLLILKLCVVFNKVKFSV